MKMNLIYLDIWLFEYLDIWIFGFMVEVGVNIKFGQKCLSGHVNIFPNFDKKTQVWTCGRDLAMTWNIKIFGYMNI
jgi:hypothetical protein